MYRSVLSFCIALIAVGSIAMAQIPKTISYQGILTDDAGNVVPDDIYRLTLKLYSVDINGQPSWTEVQDVPTVDGLFNVVLGAKTPLQLLFDRQLWLGISVGTEAELSPRIKLTSSSYSIRAQRADTSEYAMQALRADQADRADDAATVGGYAVSATPAINTILPLDASGKFPTSAIPSVPAAVQDNSLTAVKIASGEVVKSINTMHDDVELVAGSNVSIAPSGNTLIISATPGGGGGDITGVVATDGLAGGGTSGDVVVRIADQGVTTQRLADDAVTDPKIADNTVVRSINNITDHAQLTAGQNIAITPAGNTIMIEGTAGGDITSVNTPAGSGLTGGAVTGDVTLVIEDRGVTTQKLADAAVSTIKLGDGAVTSIKIADNAITSTKLADASVTAAKVSGNGATNGQTLSYDGMNVGWTTPVTGGTLDEAYDFGGPGMGKTITADAGPVTVGGTDGFLVTGTYGSGPIPATGGGARMMFYPGKAAFRSGVVNNTEWDDSNIGLYSTAMGAIARAIGEGAVSLGWQNEALGKASVALGGLNHAYADYSLAMGYASEAYAEGSTAMGYQVSAKGNGSTAMGYQGSATGNYATAFGFQCEASGLGSTASGYAAWSTGAYSTAFGQNTRATGYHSFAVGYAAVASGNTATAVGFNTTASGEKSTAMGSYVSTNGKLGSFILGDASTTSLWTSALPNQMKMRFAGGYQLYTNSTATTGVYMNGNTSGWINFSDRNRKENFTPVAGEWLLAKIRNLPVTEWNYKNSDPDVRYIGPMAQDFWQAFHLGGTDSLGINSIAIDGVNLAAIKALEERTAELQAATSRLTELTADASRSFEGEGQLRNGRVHIELDAEFARRAAIKESSPLKVFVQLEDDCNGVFITNKTATGFDVVELRRGRSNARFSYRVSVTQSAKKNSITMQISAPCTE